MNLIAARLDAEYVQVPIIDERGREIVYVIPREAWIAEVQLSGGEPNLRRAVNNESRPQRYLDMSK